MKQEEKICPILSGPVSYGAAGCSKIPCLGRKCLAYNERGNDEYRVVSCSLGVFEYEEEVGEY